MRLTIEQIRKMTPEEILDAYNEAIRLAEARADQNLHTVRQERDNAVLYHLGPFRSRFKALFCDLEEDESSYYENCDSEAESILFKRLFQIRKLLRECGALIV